MSGDNEVQFIQNLQVSDTDTTSISNGDSTSTSKLSSALSPHVPEFVPKSVALEREIQNQSYNNKPHRNKWMKTVNEEEMERNWRIRPRNDEQPKSHNVRREFKDVGCNVNKGVKEECDSLQGKSWLRHGDDDDDSTSGKRWSRGMGGGVGEEGQRGMRRGYGRGRGRGRSAWINDGNQSGESTTRNKDINAWRLSNNEHKNIRGRGRGQGVQPRASQMGSADRNERLDVHENVTTQGRNYYKLKKEIEKSDEDGKDEWIFVGKKTKMGSEKEESRTEAIGPDSSGKKFKKLNEISKRDEKSSQSLVMFERENKKGSEHEKRVFSSHGRKDVDSGRKQIRQEKNLQEKISSEKFHQEHKNIPTDQSVFLSRKLKDKVKNLDTRNEEQPQKEKKDFQDLGEKTQGYKQRGVIRLKKSIDNSTATFRGNDEEPKEKPAFFELQNNEGEFPDLASSGKSSASLSSDWLSGGNRMPIISYSAALKAIPRPTPMPSTATNTTKQTTENPYEDGNNNHQNKKKKKKKKKKEKTQEEKVEQAAQLTKKTKQPMQFDLGDWLSSIEKVSIKVKKDKQKITIAGGVLQMKLKDAPTVARATASGDPSTINSFIRKQPQGLHNILDSTAPVIKRGKEREIPKKKKPSQLKKIILKEREEKKKALDTEQQNKEQGEEEEDSAKSNCDSQEAEESEVNDEKSTQDKNAIPNERVTEDDVTVHQSASDDADCPVAPSEDDVRAHIHSRRFREYCDHVMDKQLNNTTTELLQKLVVFQDRQYHKDPIKSKAKRRFVVGLREVTKHLKLRKIKLVIISPNVERIKSAGGLDDTLHNIISIAHQNGVPVVFALRRQVLGRILHKKVPVSAIGVFSYDGAQDQFKELMDFTEKARAVYAERWQAAYDELVERIQREGAIETSCGNERKGEEIADEYDSSSDKENSENVCGGENGDHREPSSDRDKQSDNEESIAIENSKKEASEDGVAIETDLTVQDL